MPLEIIVGTQWGDEGKGRVVDWMARQADIVVRFNGGDNAGHTVTVGANTFKLHLIPSGIIHPHTQGVLGNGMVINPATLLSEMEMLAGLGVQVNPERLMISYAAHLITPAHRVLDQAQEQALGRGQIGTTGRGIGPAYTDKTARRGLRVQDMLDLANFEEKVTAHVREINRLLQVYYHPQPLEPAVIVQEYMEYARLFSAYIGDPGILLSQALKEGKRVLAEGAQGTLLDIDHGTYPFVTSSSTTAAAAFTGMGIGIIPVERVVGVTKAFQTRVGAGPFPTELEGEEALRLRGTGSNPWDEFGTTTGRPRRVGWLDGVLLRYAVRVNGLTELVMTKLDVLSGLPAIRLCHAYQFQGQKYTDLPMGPSELQDYQPVYEELPGWQENLQGVRKWSALPKNARAYLQRLEELAGVPILQVSVGPEREQVVYKA